MTNFLRICALPKVLSGDKEKYLQKKFNKEKCKKTILIKLGVLIKMALFLDIQIIIEEELTNLF